MIEDGLYSLIKANIPDFMGQTEYQMYYLAIFDPVPTPYCVLRRYKRDCDQDLSSNNGLFTSGYIIEIYHTDSWALLDVQQRIRVLLDTIPLTTVGGIFVQNISVVDDFHTTPALMQEARSRLYQGTLDFELYHNTY
ncbi:MAG: hypothetical protein P4L59_16300 [Desulfosporosinus sp.]|nr:hypothetical protein [Desulfosporosinus sp.]